MTTTFATLGLSPDVVRALTAAGITEPFPDPSADHPRRPRRPRRLRQGQDRLGQDPRLRSADARAHREGRALPPARAGARAHPRAGPAGAATRWRRSPRRVTARWACSTAAPRSSARSARSSAGLDIVVATPGRLIDLLDRGALSAVATSSFVVIDEADRMADMGFLPQVEWILRKLERHRADAALLGDARRRRAATSSAATCTTRCATRSSSQPDDRRGDGAPLPRRAPDGQGEGDRGDRARRQAHARVRAHQARRRPPRARSSSARACRRAPSTATCARAAREGADGLRRRQARRCSSPPTSPPGASTSTPSTSSCTTTRPRTTRPTCTAPAAPPAPARPASWPRSCSGTRAGRRATPEAPRRASADRRGVLQRPPPRRPRGVGPGRGGGRRVASRMFGQPGARLTSVDRVSDEVPEAGVTRTTRQCSAPVPAGGPSCT